MSSGTVISLHDNNVQLKVTKAGTDRLLADSNPAYTVRVLRPSLAQ